MAALLVELEPGVVISAAAVSGMGACETDPEHAERLNAILPEHLGLPTERDESCMGVPEFDATIQQAWDSGQPNLHQLLHDGLDRDLIQHALKQCGGNQTQLAERLGLSRNTVRKLVQKYGLE